MTQKHRRVSDQVLRSKLVRLAHARPEFRSHLLPLLKLGDSSNGKTAAGKPYLRGITKATVAAQMAFMVYSVRAEQNNSKFYEVFIEEEGGRWKLTRMSGRLNGGNPRTWIEHHQSLRDAQRSMAGHYAKRMKPGKGYVNAFGAKHISPATGKKLPKGQYPVGLSAPVPGLWGQDPMTRCVPALKNLVEQINAAKAMLEGDPEAYFPPGEIIDQLQEALDTVKTVASADDRMGEVLKPVLSRAMRRAVGGGRFKPDPGNRKLRGDFVKLINYITKQTSFC